MPVATLFGRLRRGWVNGRQETRPPHRWIITASPDESERLRALHRLPVGHHNRRRWIGFNRQTPRKEHEHHADGIPQDLH
jgi:hypothetical protein